MLLTSANVEREFGLTFPHKAAAVAEDAGGDPAGRVDWIFRHEVMSEALQDPIALRAVFDWIERLLRSDDDMIDYWTQVRLLGRTLTDPVWAPHVQAIGGPLLTQAWVARQGLEPSLPTMPPHSYRVTTLVRLMCDHSGWPLWDEEGGTGPEDWPGLSPALVARLEAWDSAYGRNWALPGRAERAFARAHLAEGKELCHAVAAELSPDYVVWLHRTSMRLRGRGTVTMVEATD